MEEQNLNQVKPTLKVRCGNVSATVFTNIVKKDDTTYSIESINLQKSYKDKNEEWKNTQSLNPQDIAKAIMCLEEVQRKLLLSSE